MAELKKIRFDVGTLLAPYPLFLLPIGEKTLQVPIISRGMTIADSTNEHLNPKV
jgi:hypothetical protein